MRIALDRSYRSRHGVPVLDAVDGRIFTATYFAECMKCTFCEDACCSWGADVDLLNVERILAEGKALEDYVGVPRDQWLAPGEPAAEPELPGGGYRRTAVRDGRCIFLDRKGRGCKLHSYMLAQGRPYNAIKPLVCALYGVSFDAGVLIPADGLADATLRCAGPGLTAYRAARGDLEWYFGRALVDELDQLEARVLAGSGRAGRQAGAGGEEACP